MNNSIRFVHSSFCDDVRHEQGNKLSLMGIYQSSLVLPAAGPRTLAKLCVVVEAQTSIDDPFQSLKIQLRKDDQMVEELNFPAEALAGVKDVLENNSDLMLFKLGSIFVLQNFPVEQPCRLSVVAITEREELLSARLKIEFATE